MYRIADPTSLKGKTHRTALAGGGWQSRFQSGPFLGVEDPAWKGAPWAWNRKFSWNGELLADFVAICGPTIESAAADGTKEWLPSYGVAYFAGLNLKMDRATVTGFPLQNRDQASNQSRVPLDPEAFAYQALQNRGK